MNKNLILIILFFSISNSQEYDPNTGKKIKKIFDPKTGEYVNEIIENSKNDIHRLKISETQIITDNKDFILNFDNIYFSETIYQKNGLWSSGYILDGQKLSKTNALNKLKTFPLSNKLFEEIKTNRIYGFIGAGVLIGSPFMAAQLNNGFVFFIGFYSGLFLTIKSSLDEINLINKGLWIYNREALKNKIKTKKEEQLN